MAQRGNEYGNQTDQYGNSIRPTDDGFVGTNLGQQYGTTGTGTGGVGVGGGMGTGMQHNKQHQVGEGMLHHRTGSGSSSSSEDDGEGGRRKKGLKQKIKEKLPGGDKGQDQQMHGTTTTAYGHEGQYEHEEKKGMMDKIKEKLPGGHN